MYELGYRKISEIVKFYGVFDKILNISYIIQNYLRFPAQVFHFSLSFAKIVIMRMKNVYS